MVDNEAKRMKMDGPDRVLIPKTESDTDSFSVINACREPGIELRPQDISNSKNYIPVQPSIRRNTTKLEDIWQHGFRIDPGSSTPLSKTRDIVFVVIGLMGSNLVFLLRVLDKFKRLSKICS